MTTANVLTQALKLMGSNGSEAGLLKLQTGTAAGTGFGQVMNDSLKTQPESKKSSAETVKPGNAPGKQFAAKPVVNETKVPETEPAADKVTMETVKAVEDGIKELVKEELGLTEEELETAMQVLGLGYLELLQPENMKALLLEVNQTDEMELLTNETLSNHLDALLAGTGDILSEAGLEVPEAEELPKLLDELLETKAAVETEMSKEQPTEAVAEEGQPKVEILVEEPKDKKAVKKETETPEEPEEKVVSEKPEEKAPVTEKKTETKTKDSESRQEKGNRDIKGEQNVNPMEELLKNLSNHISPDKVSATAADRLELMRDIVNQVLDQIRISIRPDNTSMELTLNPEHLGKINLTVVSRDGHLTASFVAQNEVTKEALESQVQILKENLSSQGIKVDAIEVNIQSFAFDERNQMNGGQEESGQSKPKGKQLSAEEIARAFGEDTDSENEPPDTVTITQSGGNVDYIA